MTAPFDVRQSGSEPTLVRGSGSVGGSAFMDAESAPGGRCRSTRPIAHARGILERASAGTIRSSRENLGRRLIAVDFDCGAKLIVFSHEIEPLDRDRTDAS